MHRHQHRAYLGFKDRCPCPDRHRKYVYLSSGSRTLRLIFVLRSYERHPHDQGEAARRHIEASRRCSHVVSQIFGWEPKTTAQLAEKREEELKYIRKSKLLELANGLTK